MLFQRIPVISNADLPILNAANIIDITSGLNLDNLIDAWDFPSLSGENGTGLIDIGSTLLVSNTASITKVSNSGNYINTGIPGDTDQTVLIAFRSDTTGGAIVFGNMNNATNGWCIYHNNGELRVNTRGGPNTIIGTHTANQWTYVAASVGDTEQVASCLHNLPGGVNLAGLTNSQAPDPLAIGPSRYTSFSNNVNLEVGYLAVAQGLLTLAEQQEKLEIMKSICEAKGLV